MWGWVTAIVDKEGEERSVGNELKIVVHEQEIRKFSTWIMINTVWPLFHSEILAAKHKILTYKNKKLVSDSKWLSVQVKHFDKTKHALAKEIFKNIKWFYHVLFFKNICQCNHTSTHSFQNLSIFNLAWSIQLRENFQYYPHPEKGIFEKLTANNNIKFTYLSVYNGSSPVAQW